MAIIARPFGTVLMFLYELVGNYGLAIILFAIFVALILLPFQMKGKRGSLRGQRLQPKIAEIRKKYAGNNQKITEETQKLYKEEGTTPTSGCIWNLVPLPILFALFLVISQPLTIMMDVSPVQLQPEGVIYQTMHELGFDSEAAARRHEQIAIAQFVYDHWDDFRNVPGIDANLRPVNFRFLGADLGQTPQWNFLWTTDWSNPNVWWPGLFLFFIPLLSGGMQMFQTVLNKKLGVIPTGPDGKPTGGAMMMLMPLISVYFMFVVPAALGLYWTMGTVLRIGQDIWLTKRYTKIIDAEDAVRFEERRKKEAELEQKRLETERRRAEGIEQDRNKNTSKRKMHMTEKQEQLQKAAEWKKKDEPEAEDSEPSRVGDRPHARGRAYDPNRFEHSGKPEEESVEDTTEMPFDESDGI